MKIRCACGSAIHDGADALPNKAHVVADRDLFPYLDRVDAAIEAQGDPERAVQAARRAWPGRMAWECGTCGRIYLTGAGGALVEYLPANGRVNRVFSG